MMPITITYDYLREEEVELIKVFRELGVEVNVLKASGLVELKRLDGVFLVRNLSHKSAITLAGIVEAYGGLSINSYRTLTITWNKAITLAMLSKAGIPIPKTYVVLNTDQVDGRVPIDGDIIVKPTSGSWGRLTAKVSNGELGLLLKHVDDQVPLLVQERIGDGTDIRVFVVGGEVVASMMRTPPDGEWRSNVARGGLARAIEVNEEVKEYAIKATEAVGAHYAGVDVLIRPSGEYYVGEVNGIPEFKAVSRVSGVRVAEVLARYIVNLAKH